MTTTARQQTAHRGPRSHWLDVGARRLHLLEWEHDQPRATLVCIHGGCANAHWWYHCAQTLATHHRILAVDLCGHGMSDPLEDGSYSLANHASDVALVLDQLELHDAVLIGHSFGGFVSLAVLPQIADRLRALVIADSRGHIRRRSARYLNALGKFRNPIYQSEAEAIASFQLLPRNHAASDDVIRHIARHSVRQHEDGTWSLAFDRRALRAATEYAFDDEIRHLRSPALIVRGEHSTALTERGMAALATELGGARTATIAGAHHHIMLDRPREFAAAVDAFV